MMMSNYSPFYILKDGKPVQVADALEWARWFESADRRVALTRVGEVEISTVFLGSDHGFHIYEDAPPVLWETLVFGGLLDSEMERYTSLDAAQRGHEAMVARVQEQSAQEAMNDDGDSIATAILAADTAINAALAALYVYEPADAAYFDHLDAIYSQAALLVERMKMLADERRRQGRASRRMDYKIGFGNVQIANLTTGVKAILPSAAVDASHQSPDPLSPFEIDTINLNFTCRFMSINQLAFLRQFTSPRLFIWFPPDVSNYLRRRAWRYWGLIAHWDAQEAQ